MLCDLYVLISSLPPALNLFKLVNIVVFIFAKNGNYNEETVGLYFWTQLLFRSYVERAFIKFLNTNSK